MSEDTNTSPKAETKRAPIPAWVLYLVVAGYAPLFVALINSYAKRDEAKNQTIEIQNQRIKELREDNADKGRDNSMLQRILYAQENFSRFLYFDSVTVAQRRAAEIRTSAAGHDERPN